MRNRQRSKGPGQNEASSPIPSLATAPPSLCLQLKQSHHLVTFVSGELQGQQQGAQEGSRPSFTSKVWALDQLLSCAGKIGLILTARHSTTSEVMD